MHRRAFLGAIGAKDTTVTRFGFEPCTTVLAFVEKETAISGHRLFLGVAALWARDGGKQGHDNLSFWGVVGAVRHR